jgi:hypothetical protein
MLPPWRHKATFMQPSPRPFLPRLSRRRLSLALLLSAPATLWAQAGRLDPDALARAAVAEARLPDKDGHVAKRLAQVVRSLPPWLPFYPGASLTADSGSDAPGQLQVGFTTHDSEEQVLRFYQPKLKAHGTPTETRDSGLRILSVKGPGGSVGSVILQPRSGGGVWGILKVDGGG